MTTKNNEGITERINPDVDHNNGVSPNKAGLFEGSLFWAVGSI